jgi:hypothetical protein
LANKLFTVFLLIEKLGLDLVLDFQPLLPALLHFFDFLPQSQEFNHLFGINFGSGKLGHIEIILVISIVRIVLFFITFSRGRLLELDLILLSLLVVHLGKL